MTDRAPAGMRATRRRTLDTDAELVVTSTLVGAGGKLPLVVRPALEGVDLSEWAAVHRDQIQRWLLGHGAILFRGFGLRTGGDFERAAVAVAPDLYGEYGDLPPEPSGEKIYGSTPYPADKAILFHNESSHLPKWPTRQFFFCVVPARDGGETPLLDCRAVIAQLDADVLAQFRGKGLMYVRNFFPGLDVSWQDFFKTADGAAVEERCRREAVELTWVGDDALRIRRRAPAVARHPVTGDLVFFNQIQLHHISCLDEETRTSLEQVFAEEDRPRNVLFGDGSAIPDDVMAHVGEVFDANAVRFPWQEGDLIMLDNMRVAHGRAPFSGPRKILVAMAGMVTQDDLPSVDDAT